MHSYSLTVERAMRDGEGAARSHTSRGCAAHAVHSLRPSGLTGGAMVRRAYRQRRSEGHTSELQSPCNLVCRLLLEKKKNSTGDADDTAARRTAGPGGTPPASPG